MESSTYKFSLELLKELNEHYEKTLDKATGNKILNFVNSELKDVQEDELKKINEQDSDFPSFVFNVSFAIMATGYLVVCAYMGLVGNSPLQFGVILTLPAAFVFAHLSGLYETKRRNKLLDGSIFRVYRKLALQKKEAEVAEAQKQLLDKYSIAALSKAEREELSPVDFKDISHSINNNIDPLCRSLIIADEFLQRFINTAPLLTEEELQCLIDAAAHIRYGAGNAIDVACSSGNIKHIGHHATRLEELYTSEKMAVDLLDHHSNSISVAAICARSKHVDFAKEIINERVRQVANEGYTEEHDDAHTDGSIANAAAYYIAADTAYMATGDCKSVAEKGEKYPLRRVKLLWPWGSYYDKSNNDDRYRQLVKGQAMALAEMERLKRLEVKPQ